MTERDDELEDVLAIARRAALLVLGVYATPFVVEMKGPGDPVTRADREANALICGDLAARFPSAAVLAEESVPDDVAALLAHEQVFFVDPLDGTREFADRNGEFAVMIGRTTAGRPDLGVVVIPVTGEALVGRVGARKSGFIEDASGRRRPLHVSGEVDPAAARLMVSRSHRPRIANGVKERLGLTREIPCGSVGVKVARVATGDADLYVHGGGGAKRWDTCAPEAILLAAGGRFTDLDGELIDYRSAELTVRTGILASNGLLHGPVLEAIAAVRGEAGRRS